MRRPYNMLLLFKIYFNSIYRTKKKYIIHNIVESGIISNDNDSAQTCFRSYINWHDEMRFQKNDSLF